MKLYCGRLVLNVENGGFRAIRGIWEIGGIRVIGNTGNKGYKGNRGNKAKGNRGNKGGVRKLIIWIQITLIT